MHVGRMPCEHEGRNQGEASISQATPEVGGQPSEAGREAQNNSSRGIFRRSVALAAPSPRAASISNGETTPELYIRQFVVLCLGSPGQRLQAGMC